MGHRTLETVAHGGIDAVADREGHVASLTR
jgi:hypothetical protein